MLREIGTLAVTARLRRVSDLLSEDIRQLYENAELSVDLRSTPLLVLLDKETPASSTKIANALGTRATEAASCFSPSTANSLSAALPSASSIRTPAS